MKIIFDSISDQSGANIWTQRMSKYLKDVRIDTEIRNHSLFYQFIRPFHFRKQTYPDNTVQHTNSWSGWSLKTDLPQVITEHTAVHQSDLDAYKTRGQRAYHAVIRKYEAKSVLCADKVICVSRFSQDCLEKTFGYPDSQVIYNGVDTQVFQPISLLDSPYRMYPDKILILFVGNLTLLKGAELLPRIMDLLDDRFILLTVHGFKQKMKISHKRIINIGTLPEIEMVKIYNACDIFLSPSRLEGFGLSVAEAMACGKPVVSMNCSSLPELVVDGKGGFLCGIDNIREFADHIQYLAGEPDERKRMGRFNREKVEEKFTLEQMVKNYIRVYKLLI